MHKKEDSEDIIDRHFEKVPKSIDVSERFNTTTRQQRKLNVMPLLLRKEETRFIINPLDKEKQVLVFWILQRLLFKETTVFTQH